MSGSGTQIEDGGSMEGILKSIRRILGEEQASADVPALSSPNGARQEAQHDVTVIDPPAPLADESLHSWASGLATSLSPDSVPELQPPSVVLPEPHAGSGVMDFNDPVSNRLEPAMTSDPEPIHDDQTAPVQPAVDDLTDPAPPPQEAPKEVSSAQTHNASPVPETSTMSASLIAPDQTFDNGIASAETAKSTAASVTNLIRAVSTDRGARTHSDGPTIADLVRLEIRPVLKAWLDDNLPPLVERLVRVEIERVVSRASD
jgi:cell pole-organizing protein PopZ